jgi:hypothetical protein
MVTMTSPESNPNSPQANAASVDWSPSLQLIANVTNAGNAVVTTTGNHGFTTGMYVLVNVPFVYGMIINQIITQIIVTGLTTFSTNINTLTQSAFTSPALAQFTPAQVSPATGLFFNSTPGSPQGNPTGGVQ